MRGVPADLSTDAQPPLAVPLQHFLAGLPFLLLGSALAVWTGLSPGTERVAVVHLLLVGWVGLTILGAMTQFVPVWSGVPLHSERLARLQLPLVGGGVAGLATGLWTGSLGVAALAGVPLVAGFAVFVYTLSRTLLAARPWDVTEGHFAFALGCLALAVGFGASLLVDYLTAVYPLGDVTRTGVVATHLTLALFGGVVATVAGALYQLGPMFTQYDPDCVDRLLRRAETAVYPLGVLLLAAGRVVGHGPTATVGGLFVAAGIACVGVFLARCLVGATADYSPMLPRYAVVAVAALVWAPSAALAWAADPLSTAARFGDPTVGALLLGALVGFVVVGTLYHVVPFLIWVHRYSDRVGFEPVPTIDDLYDGRLARVDLAATVAGALLVVVGALVSPTAALLGGGLAVVGTALVVGNLTLTVVRHAPDAVGGPVSAPADD